jgi:protein O-GlcNAc transferase
MGRIVDRLDRKRFQPVVACAQPGIDRIGQNPRNKDVQLLALPHHFDHAIAKLRAERLDLICLWEVGTDSPNYFLPFFRLGRKVHPDFDEALGGILRRRSMVHRIG